MYGPFDGVNSLFERGAVILSSSQLIYLNVITAGGDSRIGDGVCVCTFTSKKQPTLTKRDIVLQKSAFSISSI